MIKILYFARLRDELGVGQESMELPETVQNTEQLRSWLCRRGLQWQAALHTDGLFVAVDQTVVDWQQPLKGSEEVAFFPPVTGG